MCSLVLYQLVPVKESSHHVSVFLHSLDMRHSSVSTRCAKAWTICTITSYTFAFFSIIIGYVLMLDGRQADHCIQRADLIARVANTLMLAMQCTMHRIETISTALPAGRVKALCLWVCLQVGTQLPVNTFQQNSTSLFACTPSIECEPQYAHLADGIVAIYAVDPTSKTVGLCTGEISFSCRALPQYPRCQQPLKLLLFHGVVELLYELLKFLILFWGN